jgi:hypothetical protein
VIRPCPDSCYGSSIGNAAGLTSPALYKKGACEKMSAEVHGLTLEGLAQRLDSLERENAELRNKVATLADSGTRSDDEELRPEFSWSDQEVSRRSLLRKAGAAAVGLVVAGALTQRDIRQAKADPTYFTTDTYHHGAVEARNTNAGGYGVFAEAPNHGVYARTPGGYGNDAVLGISGVDGTGVLGQGGRWGVHGISGYGIGVHGSSTKGHAISGEGFGSTHAGVHGRNPNGYGGQFDGGKAQLKLNPKKTTGRPTSGAHIKGEIYMDSAGTLFVCTANGTPGTWRRFTTTAV